MLEDKTSKLQDELNTKGLETYLNEHSFDEFSSLDFALSLKTSLEEKSLKASYIIENSELSKSYVYAILSGKKIPSRDKVISISLLINTGVDECNCLLKAASYRFLHPKSKRDSVIIFALNRNFSLTQTNIELEKAGCEILK